MRETDSGDHDEMNYATRRKEEETYMSDRTCWTCGPGTLYVTECEESRPQGNDPRPVARGERRS